MGKFINTRYKETIDSVVDGFKDKLKNPYYLHTDKKAIITNYFNQNSTKSTMDEATRDKYSNIGSESPTGYNKIVGAYLYGNLGIMAANYEIGDFGPQASSIEGELFILPNTFIPYPEDYFTIEHVNQTLLFKVIDITIDTLDNGANFYKIQFKLDTYSKLDEIEKQIVNYYKMIINNVGTNFKAIILENDYNFVDTLESFTNRLKKYYQDLFFKKKVQTFIYEYNGEHFYDPFMIEFIIRNSILEGGDYVYISHQTYLNSTFSIDYDRTIFRNIELKKKNIKNVIGQASLIQDPNSLMCVRMEDYYKIQYDGKIFLGNPIETIPADVMVAIKDNILLEDEDKLPYNILINYLNGVETFDPKYIDIIENIDYQSNKDLFYLIPMIIYILEYYIKTLLK